MSRNVYYIFWTLLKEHRVLPESNIINSCEVIYLLFMWVCKCVSMFCVCVSVSMCPLRHSALQL